MKYLAALLLLTGMAFGQTFNVGGTGDNNPVKITRNADGTWTWDNVIIGAGGSDGKIYEAPTLTADPLTMEDRQLLQKLKDLEDLTHELILTRHQVTNMARETVCDENNYDLYEEFVLITSKGCTKTQ
jgi:hypothetical protein